MNVEIVKEIRFAVVMYGGVSLAIYINGVSQEMLRMVRATATKKGSGDLSEEVYAVEKLDLSEKIYRYLGIILANKDLLLTVNDSLLEGQNWQHTIERFIDDQINKGKPVKTVKFVIDILSGTSAGGINGIYLAKAIAYGQDLNILEELWKAEGNFSKLLYDRLSVLDTILQLPKKPTSLLNGERMYLKLLEAFYAMDENSLGGPLTDELDLFVTVTDYWGMPVKIRLFDKIITEKRHLQHLHFRLLTNQHINDFQERVYPLLAFAARCTSSFPMAFEPMTLEKAIGLTVRKSENISKKFDVDEFRLLSKNYFKPRFLSIISPDKHQTEIEWNRKPLVDGGYLDNKPFGYVIDALGKKQSDTLIDRKLVYIEPKPDSDFTDRANMNCIPNAIKNIKTAAFEMPGYETIYDELQMVLKRNRMITRIDTLVSNARKDELESLLLSLDILDNVIGQENQIIRNLLKKYKGFGYKKDVTGKQRINWDRLELGEVAQQKGHIAYPYYRLRVAALTDDLAELIVKKMGLDNDSDLALIMRDMFYIWRKNKFPRGEDSVESSAKINGNLDALTPMYFLSKYDFNYRLRRLRFVLRQADNLFEFGESLKREFELTKNTHREFINHLASSSKFDHNLNSKQIRALRTKFPMIESELFETTSDSLPSKVISEADSDLLKKEIKKIKHDLNQILSNLKKQLGVIDISQFDETVEANSSIRKEIETLNEQVQILSRQIQEGKTDQLLANASRENPNSSNINDDIDSRHERAKLFLDNNPDANQSLEQIGNILLDIYDAPWGNIEKGEFKGNPFSTEQSIFTSSRLEVAKLFDVDPYSEQIESEDVNTSILNKQIEIRGALLSYLRHFYNNFDSYDQIIFPLTYDTPVGEGVKVDIARISPIDSTSLIDQTNRGEVPIKRKKLAGTAFMSFGAFFDERWRQNDISWGKLDAAERLITIVLNNKENPEMALEERILEDLQKATLDHSDNDWIGELFEDHMKSCSSECNSRYEFFKNCYSVENFLEKSSVAPTAARAISIVQKVVQESGFGLVESIKGIGLAGAYLLTKPILELTSLRYTVLSFSGAIFLLGSLFFLFLPAILFVGGALYFSYFGTNIWILTAVTLTFWLILLIKLGRVVKNKIFLLATGKE